MDQAERLILEQWKHYLSAQAESVPCSLHVHHLDRQTFYDLLQCPEAKSVLNGLEKSLNTLFGIQVYFDNSVIPGFVEVRDQRQKIIKTIKLVN